MAWITGIRFKPAGKIYYFACEQFDLQVGDPVIVETVKGVEYGLVALPKQDMEERRLNLPLKPVIRKATDDDQTRYQNNKKKEKDAMDICRNKVKEHQLPMRLIDVEYTFDLTKIIFYFAAEGRVDFRYLVKDLAAIFKTRIELRQIGVRDEAKMIGGIGTCGRILCCNNFLGEFVPVSIRMAKEQNLSLNPAKISGICSRLMCCLKFESEIYEDAKGQEGRRNGKNCPRNRKDHAGTDA